MKQQAEKRSYLLAEAKVVTFETTDVITTSDGKFDGNGEPFSMNGNGANGWHLFE